MKLVLLGSPSEIIKPFQQLIDDSKKLGVEIVAVVSQPARRVGRGKTIADPPFAAFAKEQGLKVLQPEKASNPEFLEELRNLEPDVMITAAYGQILNQEFLDIPTRATINIHPSLLPKYRGAIPVPASLLAGDKETGVSILFTVKKLDAGNIILQESVSIAPEETADVLMERLFALSGDILPKALDLLTDPDFSGTPQDEALITHCKKIDKADGLIDWSESAEKIFNQYRGLFPWPGSYTFLQGKKVNLEKVKMIPEDLNLGSNGQFQYSKKEKTIQIQTGSGTIVALQLKMQGSKIMDAASFWNGLKNKKDTCFEPE